MSSTSVSPLSAGTQQLYDKGLLPSSLPNSVIGNSSAGQLGRLAADSVALQQVDALLGIGTSSTTSTDSASTDPLSAAVTNALTSNLNAAVQKFLPQDSTTTGSQIDLLA